MNIQNNDKYRISNPKFSGHNKTMGKKGDIEHNFYYLYDKEKYYCEVEIFNISRDKQGNFEAVKNPAQPSIPLESGKSKKIAVKASSDTLSNIGFAYRFKLTSKDTGKQSYAFDNGDVIGIGDKNPENKFTVVLKNRAVINKNGPMQLIMIDEYYPESTGKDKDGKPTISEALRGTVLSSVRTHANKLGGRLEGITNNLSQLEKEGITRIVGTPYTKDTVSSHKYWTENAYQLSPDLGNENDFKNLQIELFKKGINWIADAALVNEGISGIHINNILKWGKTSSVAPMFDVSDKIKLGILPSKTNNSNDKTIQSTKMKIINAPFELENGKVVELKDAKKYDKTKPTYIQFYDSRLVSDEQKKSDSPKRLMTYDKRNTDNIYDITKHDDAIYPFAIEVDPIDLLENVELAIKNDYKITDLKEIPYDAIKTIADFENFQVTTKNDAGNIACWDGNVDIPKFNFFMPDEKNKSKNAKIADDAKEALLETPKMRKLLELGGLAARDYAINSGRYWTRLTSNIQQDYIVSKLQDVKDKSSPDAYLEKIKELTLNGDFPKDIDGVITRNLDGTIKEDKEIIDNVLKGDYKLRRLSSQDEKSLLIAKTYRLPSKRNIYNIDDYILKYALDMPLETLPVANNLMGVLSSPYISQRALNEKELGLSKFDILQIRELEGSKNPDIYKSEHSKMNDIYKDKIVPMINNIVKDIEYKDNNGKTVGVFDNDNNVTDYGRYVLSEIVPDLTKYLLIKSLSPKAEIGINNGRFDFTKIDEDKITLQSLGIPYKEQEKDALKVLNTEQSDANKVINSIITGLESIDQKELDKLKEQAEKRFKGRTLNDYKIAEMIHDRTESGLGWRIDAAKDVADMGFVREMIYNNDLTENTNKQIADANEYMQRAWKNVTGFWKVYNQTVLKENPHAYTTAEITDIGDNLMKKYDKNADFICADDAKRKFSEQTGITSEANYDYFFSSLPNYFTQKNTSSGNNNNEVTGSDYDPPEMTRSLMKKLIDGWKWDLSGDKDFKKEFGEQIAKEIGGDNPGFLFQSPTDGVNNAYNFVGNHDKPRIIHTLALDMDLFEQGLNSEDKKKLLLNALYPEIGNKKIDEYFDKIKNSEEKIHNKRIVERLKKEFDGIITSEDIDKYLKGDEIEKQSKLDELLDRKYGEQAEYVEDIDTFVVSFIKDDYISYTDIVREVLPDQKEIVEYLISLHEGGINRKAAAMGIRMLHAISDECSDDKKLAAALRKATGTLIKGEYKGSKFNAEAFGTRPFETVIDSIFNEAEYEGVKLTKEQKENIKAKLLKNILDPALGKFLSIYKLLVCMPGSPTDFAGDRVGISGYETKSKNYHQQNRNAIHWDYLDPKNKSKYGFIQTFNEKMNKISNLRKQPELSALNNGTAVALPVGELKKLQAILRYDDKGSIVISLHNNTGANVSNEESMKLPKMGSKEAVVSDKIMLNSDIPGWMMGKEDWQLNHESADLKHGLKHGIHENIVFKDAGFLDGTKTDDGSYYKFKKTPDGSNYVLTRFKMEKGQEKEIDIEITKEDNNSLVLYKVDKELAKQREQAKMNNNVKYRTQ